MALSSLTSLLSFSRPAPMHTSFFVVIPQVDIRTFQEGEPEGAHVFCSASAPRCVGY